MADSQHTFSWPVKIVFIIVAITISFAFQFQEFEVSARVWFTSDSCSGVAPCSGGGGGTNGGGITPPDPVGYFRYVIINAGNIGEASGTLKAFTQEGVLISSWNAGSGDNDPAHDEWQWDESDNDPWGGPIPRGTWNVRKQGSNQEHPTWYPLDPDTYTGPRFGFYFHGWGETHGCISLESGKYSNFSNTVNNRWPSGQDTLPLYVSY